MIFFRLLPVFFSSLLITAHFFRAGALLPAAICLWMPFFLIIRRPWSVRAVQVFLLLASFEWMRTLFYHVEWRMESGMPWLRLAIILGVVAAITGGSALIFQLKSVHKRYWGK